MAKSIATVTGTALVPGVSRNGRLYTKDNIGSAVARAQTRIADGKRPISMRTHHAADDDSTRIVGRVTKMWQDPDTGAARYRAQIADTTHGRDIAALVDDSDGEPQFLRGVSIRGAWATAPRTVDHGGQKVTTADDLEIAGLDYTAEPGVDDADARLSSDGNDDVESAAASSITESAPEALVTTPVQQPEAPVEAATAMSKRTSGISGAGGPYADPGYLDDKKQRYQLDTKAHAKAAWSYVNQGDNAKAYTAAQLKRIKGRIIKALKRFGVSVAAESAYLIDPVVELGESTDVREYLGDYDSPSAAGSYMVSLTNGPTTVTVASYQVDPADLDLIGRAAMDGACKALIALDPDMDGDIDVPGAAAEDTDHDDAGGAQPGMACGCGCGCAVPHPDTANECPCGCGCGMCRAADPDAGESAPAQTPDPAEAGQATQPAPDPAADPTTDEEEPAMSEPTTPAVEPSPTAAPVESAAAPAASVTLTGDQFTALLERLTTAPAPAAPAPVIEPPAPAATPPATQETAPVPAAPVETEEQRIGRIVAEQVAAAKLAWTQELVESGKGPERRGLVAPAGTAPGQPAPVAEGLNAYGMPASAPNKPLSQYTVDELNEHTGTAVVQHFVAGARVRG